MGMSLAYSCRDAACVACPTHGDCLSGLCQRHGFGAQGRHVARSLHAMASSTARAPCRLEEVDALPERLSPVHLAPPSETTKSFSKESCLGPTLSASKC